MASPNSSEVLRLSSERALCTAGFAGRGACYLCASNICMRSSSASSASTNSCGKRAQVHSSLFHETRKGAARAQSLHVVHHALGQVRDVVHHLQRSIWTSQESDSTDRNSLLRHSMLTFQGAVISTDAESGRSAGAAKPGVLRPGVVLSLRLGMAPHGAAHCGTLSSCLHTGGCNRTQQLFIIGTCAAEHQRAHAGSFNTGPCAPAPAAESAG